MTATPDTKPGKLLTAKALAEALGFSEEQIWRYCRKAGFPHIRVNCRCYRFRLSDVNQWLNARTR